MPIHIYICKLRKQMRESTNATEREALNLKMRYAIAYRQGEDALKVFRDRAIEREIGKKFTEGAQIAILYNRETNPDEYVTYQSYRAACKAKVDAYIATLSAELTAEITAK